MSSHSWLRTDMSANRWQQTYFKNFVDISGDLYIRKGGISAGDNADKFTVNSNGASSIVFRSKSDRNNDYGYIKYQDDRDSPSKRSLLTIGCENDSATRDDASEFNYKDDIALMPANYVGIGTTNPSEKLDVSGNEKASSFISDGDITI